MAFCANCGAQVEGRFCQKCGAPVAGAPMGGATMGGAPIGGAPMGAGAPSGTASPEYQSQTSSAGLSENAAGAICYLFGFITGILFLVLAPYNQNRNVKFHAFQSIFLNLGWFVLWIADVIVSIVLGHIPIMGGYLRPSWVLRLDRVHHCAAVHDVQNLQRPDDRSAHHRPDGPEASWNVELGALAQTLLL